MPEFIGPIAIPEVAAAGVFPVPIDFGMDRVTVIAADSRGFSGCFVSSPIGRSVFAERT
jgi:hypothetical protein